MFPIDGNKEYKEGEGDWVIGIIGMSITIVILVSMYFLGPSDDVQKDPQKTEVQQVEQ